MAMSAADVLANCFVPSSPHGNDRPLASSDFATYLATIDQKLSTVAELVIELADDNTAAHLLVICGEHSVESLWTTDFSLKTSVQISSHLIRPSVFERSPVVERALRLIRSRLHPTTFKCNPASSTCFAWILKHLQRTQVSEHLHNLVPTALILTDDFEAANIKLGADCLRHISERVAAEQLKWTGWTEVTLDALTKCFCRTEAEVLPSLLDSFVALMKCNLLHSTSLLRCKFDETLKVILFNMYLESGLTLRRIYAGRIGPLVEARKLGAVRHFTLIFKILEEYALDPATTLEALQGLRQLLRSGWCRGEVVADSVAIILLKVLASHATKGAQINDPLLTSVRQTSGLLREVSPQVVDRLLTASDNSSTLCGTESTTQLLNNLQLYFVL